ncbi:MAG: hypothetical protein ABI277_10815 [Burkholderiaceae bacterium]
MKTVHDVSAQGFAASADHDARGRPHYPGALTGWLREAARIAAGSTVTIVKEAARHLDREQVAHLLLALKQMRYNLSDR